MDMLGDRIALLRRGRKWSQTELAKRLHISASAVGMYEQGRREPSLVGLAELAEVFGVSADYLLTGKPLTKTDEKVLADTMAGQLVGCRGRREKSGLTRQELQLLLEAMLQEA
jgi:transcriptional regulator with XRE-family HTH domain